MDVLVKCGPLDLAWMDLEAWMPLVSSLCLGLSFRIVFILKLLIVASSSPGLCPFCWVTTREKSDFSPHSNSTNVLEIALTRCSWVIHLSLNKSLWPEECSGLIGWPGSHAPPVRLGWSGLYPHHMDWELKKGAGNQGVITTKVNGCWPGKKNRCLTHGTVMEILPPFLFFIYILAILKRL